MTSIFNSPLKAPTPGSWVPVVLQDFDSFLLDHAACERKAAALAMSFVAKYPDRGALIEPMVCLAREELEHFHQVYRLMRRRGLSLTHHDEKDPYVNAILGELRHGREERFLDRLIASALIEARGHERFTILAQHHGDESLKIFYQRLADSEAGHFNIFVRVAQSYFSSGEIEEAIGRIAVIESRVMLATPHRAALH
jgi:tRNA-(ms[2]io[6]A)-hydroxylase